MSRIYHDDDVDPSVLTDDLIAVVGYGNQGRSQALNLRDSGLSVLVGGIGDSSSDQARQDGFEVVAIPEACRRADGVMLLIPDEVMPPVFAQQVEPELSSGMWLDFASGYNVAFGEIAPPADVDVLLVAPRMIGPGVRDRYVDGQGFPSFVGVHQDATGHASARMLALAHALGSTRAGCIEMSFHDEASLDLFTEQGFGPAFGAVLLTAVELLVEAGYPPEAVLVELYLSGELAYTLEKAREVGFLKQMDFHSPTSQYGSITRSAHFADLREPLKKRMQKALEAIRSGEFATEWSGMREKGAAVLEQVKKAREGLPMAKWERSAREAFRIGSRS